MKKNHYTKSLKICSPNYSTTFQPLAFLHMGPPMLFYIFTCITYLCSWTHTQGFHSLSHICPNHKPHTPKNKRVIDTRTTHMAPILICFLYPIRTCGIPFFSNQWPPFSWINVKIIILLPNKSWREFLILESS
jgi:hypothetical protein